MRIILSLILVVLLSLNSAFAAPMFNPEGFIQAGTRAGNAITTSSMISKVDTALNSGLTSILTLLYEAGLVVAVCVFAFLSVQVLIASPQQKANLKASLYPYFIGLLLYIAGVPIAILIINIIISFF